MLLGDLVGRLDDDVTATETLMALGDLALVGRARRAAAAAGLPIGAFVATAVRRYLDRAPADEWTTLMGGMADSEGPGLVLLARALAFGIDHAEHADASGDAIEGAEFPVSG